MTSGDEGIGDQNGGGVPGGLGAAERVAVVAAMVPELTPLVRATRLERIDLGGARAFEGRRGGRLVVAAVTAMGTVAATDVTARLLDAREVDHVLVIGIAGAVDPALAIGALLRPAAIEDEATGRVLAHTPLGTASPSGTLLTTDQLHNTPEALEELRARGVIAVDMETAAMGAVCEERGIAWSALRAISDRAGDPDVDEELIGMSNADGSPRPGAAVRYVLRHPARVPKLARLGRGMRAAVATSTAAALAALDDR